MTPSYKTTVRWLGGRKGFLSCGNGPAMAFAAPPDAHGEYGVLTPEDAFVAAVNTCIHMMFIWACERFKIDLVSYECEAEGFKQVRLDQTEEFSQVILRPHIVARGSDESRVRRAVQSARKYSLIAESIRCPVTVEPTITIVE
jgi:organic hydroperoxide reductase OsmC/OhrA